MGIGQSAGRAVGLSQTMFVLARLSFLLGFRREGQGDPRLIVGHDPSPEIRAVLKHWQ